MVKIESEKKLINKSIAEVYAYLSIPANYEVLMP
ncbi:MAG: hypothetical protein ACI8ZQ_001828, partial [Bacteroidia bacterium]